MADSVAISIQVIESTVPTYIVEFDVQPRTVARNGILLFKGFLSRIAGSPEGNAVPPQDYKINGETIEIQIKDPADGVFKGTGVTDTTRQVVQAFVFNGYFEVSMQLDPASMPVGTYDFRAHYNGNTGKNLGGCEKNVGISVSEFGVDYGPWVIGGLLIAGLAVVGYVATKK